MPNGVHAIDDSFSRGAIVAAALRVKSRCINLENGFRGGEVGIGGRGAFEVEVFGRGSR